MAAAAVEWKAVGRFMTVAVMAAVASSCVCILICSQHQG